MKGLAQAVKGMKLVNTDHIYEQGQRAYRMGIEINQNPHTKELERSVWDKGWKSGRDKWLGLLKRNDGSLSGMRFNVTHRSN